MISGAHLGLGPVKDLAGRRVGQRGGCKLALRLDFSLSRAWHPPRGREGVSTNVHSRTRDIYTRSQSWCCGKVANINSSRSLFFSFP